MTRPITRASIRGAGLAALCLMIGGCGPPSSSNNTGAEGGEPSAAAPTDKPSAPRSMRVR